MKFVLDTNVLIAAFISSGVCHEILEYVIRNHRLVLSDFIVGEFKEKLLAKFHYSEKEANEALGLLMTRAEMVHISPLQARVSRDPADDNINCHRGLWQLRLYHLGRQRPYRSGTLPEHRNHSPF